MRIMRRELREGDVLPVLLRAFFSNKLKSSVSATFHSFIHFSFIPAVGHVAIWQLLSFLFEQMASLKRPSIATTLKYSTHF
jgi:hypothetical protein